jgi:hypothetical protein
MKIQKILMPIRKKNQLVRLLLKKRKEKLLIRNLRRTIKNKKKNLLHSYLKALNNLSKKKVKKSSPNMAKIQK